MTDLESLYDKAIERNPAWTKAFYLIWMKGGMSTEDYRTMLNQIIGVVEC